MHGKLSITPVAIAILKSCLLKLAKSSPDQQQPWPTIHLSSFSILLFALNPVPTPKNIQFKMGSREYLRLGPGLFLNSVEPLPSGVTLALQNEYLGLMEKLAPNKLCCLFGPQHLHTFIPLFWGLSLPIISLDWNKTGKMKLKWDNPCSRGSAKTEAQGMIWDWASERLMFRLFYTGLKIHFLDYRPNRLVDEKATSNLY